MAIFVTTPGCGTQQHLHLHRVRPEPRDAVDARGARFKSTLPSSSSSVESIMCMNRFNRFPPRPLAAHLRNARNHGHDLRERPSFMTFSNCSYMSLQLNSPC